MTTKNTKPGDRMTEATRQRIRSKLGTQDELNPEFIFQGTATDLLLAAVSGMIDPALLAQRELANRGLDAKGQWVGFDRAREIHLRGTTGDKDAAQTAAAEIARRHLQIECLDSRNSDGLDFHEISIWSLRDALIAAFEAGVRQIHGRED